MKTIMVRFSKSGHVMLAHPMAKINGESGVIAVNNIPDDVQPSHVVTLVSKTCISFDGRLHRLRKPRLEYSKLGDGKLYRAGK